MKLISGFFGAELTDDGYIKPKVGWAVGDVKVEEDKKTATAGTKKSSGIKKMFK